MNKLMLEDGLLPVRSVAILGGGRSYTPGSWLVGACLLALLSSTVPGFADVISMSAVGADQSSTARHAVAPPPLGTYDLDGHSIDNRGTNGRRSDDARSREIVRKTSPELRSRFLIF
jgi:hypothetical protein